MSRPPEESGASPECGAIERGRSRRWLIAICVVFAASRLSYETVSPGVGAISLEGNLLGRALEALSGENLEVDTLERGMPLIDETLLRHDLGRSLYYLHSQPPLFNLIVAGVLRLPGDFARNYQFFNWGLGLALYLTAYHLMLLCGVGRTLAFVLTVAFMLNPNAMWMESAVYYGVLMALLLTLAGLCFVRAVRSGSAWWSAGCCACLGLMPLTRAYFTLPWLLLSIGLAVMGVRLARGSLGRGVVLGALIPCLLVAGLQIKQWLLFGQPAGSSWLGCNLATMTGGMSLAKERELARGNVSGMVRVYRNDTPEVFKRYFPVETTGIPILDMERKGGGEPNFHNLVYLPACRQFLDDTLSLIRRYPHYYALNVVNSTYIFSGFEIGMYFDVPRRFLARWSPIRLIAPFVGFPIILTGIAYGVKRMLRSGLPTTERLVAAFLTWNFFYVMLVAVLIEKSEGPLYRYQADSLLCVLLGLAATEWLRRTPAGGWLHALVRD